MTTVDTSCRTFPLVPMSDESAQQTARTFKALGDPVRIKLLSLIAASPEQEACICDLTAPVGLSQGTVSHHMKILTEAGFVTREQRGKWAYFGIARAGFAYAQQALDI